MNRIGLQIALGLALFLGAAGVSAAAESPCGGEASTATTAALHGPVLHVLDGHTLCIATGADPSSWIPVALDDAPAQASWGALMSVAFGKNITCAVTAAHHGVCTLDGQSLGARLQDPEVAKAAIAWRRPDADLTGETRAPVALRIAATAY